MGYESKVLVGHRFEMGSGYVGFDELAVFDLAKMGWETVNRKHFNDNFKTPIDFNIYLTNYDPEKEYPNEFFREDCYGSHCKYTDIDSLINWLEKSETAAEYWRAKIFLTFLRSLKEEAPDCVCVHYGY